MSTQALAGPFIPVFDGRLETASLSIHSNTHYTEFRLSCSIIKSF